MNYKLTTDLIADCIALSAKHKDLINESKYFGVETDGNEYYIRFAKWFDGLFLTREQVLEDLQNKRFNFYKEAFPDFAEYCLRTLPEFQDENPKITKLNNELIKYKGANHQDYREDVRAEIRELIKYVPTIASATLHGQGEFPPSTLEELCESYKNVMSKQL